MYGMDSNAERAKYLVSKGKKFISTFETQIEKIIARPFPDAYFEGFNNDWV